MFLIDLHELIKAAIIKVKTTIKTESVLIEFLQQQYPDSPLTRIRKLLKSGRIRINGRQVTLHSFRLKPGDEFEVISRQERPSAEIMPFPVLFEDDDVIVIDKPAGLPTSDTGTGRNVMGIINSVFEELKGPRKRAFVVHRLDKEVSGVLLFAKSREAMEIIKDKWKETKKHYYAFVEGKPEKEEGSIESWLIEDKAQKVHSTFEREGAKFSVTLYRVIKYVKGNALLDVTILTGRKNQIRVHMSDLGCPIIGDRKYGASENFKRRVRLHACSLSFPHPVTGQEIIVNSPMPGGFLVLNDRDEHYK